jgi:broad specificity phosphatase PhoE
MTRLLLVRHGRSVMNAQQRLQGWLDSPLDDVGRVQAQATAHRLRRESPEILYTSTLSRAAETAHIIAQELGIPVVPDERLKERDLGQLSGLSNDEIQERFAEWVHRRQTEAQYVPPPGAEATEGFSERVRQVVRDIVERHPHGTVGVVSHGGVIGMVVSQQLGLAWQRHRPFSLANGSLTIIEAVDDRWRVHLLNDRCHLEED